MRKRFLGEARPPLEGLRVWCSVFGSTLCRCVSRAFGICRLLETWCARVESGLYPKLSAGSS